MEGCLCIQQTWSVRVPTSLTLSWWDEKRLDATGRGWHGEPREDCQAQPPPAHLALRVLCAGSTSPGSPRPWPHPFPSQEVPSSENTQSRTSNLAHPLFLHCIGYSMSITHKHWSGVGRRARFKVPFALKELTGPSFIWRFLPRIPFIYVTSTLPELVFFESLIVIVYLRCSRQWAGELQTLFLTFRGNLLRW